MPEAGKYGIVYADPPWRYDRKRGSGAAENHYPTMSIVDRCNPGLTDLFLAQARRECVQAQEQKPSVRDSLNKSAGQQAENSDRPKMNKEQAR